MAYTLTHLYSLSRRRMESLREPYMHLSPSNVLASLLAPEDKDEETYLEKLLHSLSQPVQKKSSLTTGQQVFHQLLMATEASVIPLKKSSVVTF